MDKAEQTATVNALEEGSVAPSAELSMQEPNPAKRGHSPVFTAAKNLLIDMECTLVLSAAALQTFGVRAACGTTTRAVEYAEQAGATSNKGKREGVDAARRTTA